jgi:hypothetical protein
MADNNMEDDFNVLDQSPGPFGDLFASPIIQQPIGQGVKRKRGQNKCRNCGNLGHMQKTCSYIPVDVAPRAPAVFVTPSPQRPTNRRVASPSSSDDDLDEVDNSDSEGDDVNSIREFIATDAIDDDDDDFDEDPTIGAAVRTQGTAIPAVDDSVWIPSEISEWVPTGRPTRGGTIPVGDQSVESWTFPDYTGQTQSDKATPARASAASYFLLFFCDLLLNNFISQTNAFAEASKHKKWKSLNIEEFKRFLAVIIFLGVNKVPRMKMAWTKGSPFFNGFISNIMKWHRFRAILSCWHWQNNYGMSETERRAKNKANGFWSVDGYCNLLSERFTSYYWGDQCICIDEQCIGFKGRHRCR